MADPAGDVLKSFEPRGNIDLNTRPIVKNQDNSISTVRSMSFNEDGKEVLIPTVAADGSRILSEQEAIQQYHNTHQYLGIFDTPELATAYAQQLHQQQAQQYANPVPQITGDPEAAGAAAASTAMEPVTGKYLSDVASGRMALSGIQSTNEAFRTHDYPTLATMFGPQTIGGLGAKTANIDANAIATMLEVAGARPETIFKQTGWYRDVDNQWKFEISDRGAELNENAFRVRPDVIHDNKLAYHLKTPGVDESAPKTLGEAIHHPELFQAYPEIAKLPIKDLPNYKFGGGLKGNMQGAGTPSEHMGLSPDLPNEVLSTTLHESQHWIQNREGFARGGSQDEFIPARKWAERLDDLKNRDALEGELNRVGIPPRAIQVAFHAAINGDELLPGWQNSLNKLEQQHPDLFAAAHQVYSKDLAWENLQRDAFNQYLSLAGESEARNVQLRHTFPDIESTIPTNTAPVRGRDQIIKMQGEK